MCARGALASTPETRWPPGRIELGGGPKGGCAAAAGWRCRRRRWRWGRCEREATTGTHAHAGTTGENRSLFRSLSLALTHTHTRYSPLHPHSSSSSLIRGASVPPFHLRPPTPRIGFRGYVRRYICMYALPLCDHPSVPFGSVQSKGPSLQELRRVCYVPRNFKLV